MNKEKEPVAANKKKNATAKGLKIDNLIKK